jgi:type I restriction enzyme R subunit
MPDALKRSPGLRALYNNLRAFDSLEQTDGVRERPEAYGAADDGRLSLAMSIDETVKRVRPDGFRGHQARENVIKQALLPLLGNSTDEVERIFLIIKQQSEY